MHHNRNTYLLINYQVTTTGDRAHENNVYSRVIVEYQIFFRPYNFAFCQILTRLAKRQSSKISLHYVEGEMEKLFYDLAYRSMNSFEYRRLGVASIMAIIQQVTMVQIALFRVDLGKNGFTIARYLCQVSKTLSNHIFQ